MQKTIDLSTVLLGFVDISDASNRKALKDNGLAVTRLGHETTPNSGYSAWVRIKSIESNPLTGKVQSLSLQGFAKRLRLAFPYSAKHITAKRLASATNAGAYVASGHARFQGCEQLQATPLQGVVKARGQRNGMTKQKWGGNIV